jgi:hypothetical protein
MKFIVTHFSQLAVSTACSLVMHLICGQWNNQEYSRIRTVCLMFLHAPMLCYDTVFYEYLIQNSCTLQEHLRTLWQIPVAGVSKGLTVFYCVNTGIMGTNFSCDIVVLLHFFCVYALLHRQRLCDRPIPCQRSHARCLQTIFCKKAGGLGVHWSVIPCKIKNIKEIKKNFY